MFILRRITSEGNEVNMVVGESYNVTHSQFNEAEFIKLKDILKIDNSEAEIFCFITYKGGIEYEPLYKKSSYYMMTENGNTFANLSFK